MIKARDVLRLVVVVQFALAGCGDDSADENLKADAVAKCNALVDAYCSAIDSCSAYTSYGECQGAARGELNCASAVDYTDSYDQCMSDMNAVACETGGIPASCQGVILTE